jgi:hypothetical protein
MINSNEPNPKTIKVHLLNFYGVTSHVEICLEYNQTYQDGSVETKYLTMNRWAEPTRWFISNPQQLENANEKISFEINADPNNIYSEWHRYWHETVKDSSIVGDNCAVASQWFLTTYCAIPAPCTSGFNINHMALGVCWPSFIPCPILLPGRVMDNAKFHLATKDDKKLLDKTAAQVLKEALSFLSKILVSAAILVLNIAAIVLLSIGAIIGLATAGAVMGGKYMIDYLNHTKLMNNSEHRYHAPGGYSE